MESQKITPHLWFDHQAEEAATLYVSLFKNSKMGSVSRYPEAAEEVSGQKAGTAMTVEFSLDGQDFLALNGGPMFKFTEAVSFMIHCEDQAEVDHFWNGLIADGGEESQCGWLKDKFGLSWQVVPKVLSKVLTNPDPEKANRAMQAMLKMKKLVIADLEKAAE